MSKFFMKKKVIIIIVTTVLAIMVGLIIGTNIVNTMKAKEKAAEKAKVEQSIEEKKKVAKDIGDEKKVFEKSETEIEEENLTDEYKKYQELSDEEKAKVEVIPRKVKVDYDNLDDIKEEQEEDLGNQEDSLPRKFDLRDKIDITIEDQYDRGLCWDFAALTSLETNLALTKGEYYDFSEIYIDYLMSFDLSRGIFRGPAWGGNFDTFLDYASLGKGFLPQDKLEYRDYEDYEYNTFYEMDTGNDIRVTKAVMFPSFERDNFSEDKVDEEFKKFQDTVKTHIMNYGSVWTGMEMIQYETNIYFADQEEFVYADGSHAVSIVGWDDNYSRENFISPTGKKPEHDGAYIVANSWGSWWGDNGYFYISYDDVFVHSDMAGIISTDVKDMIKLSSISNKPIREYIEKNYYDKIVDVNGIKYIAEHSLKNQISIDLSNIGLTNLDDIELFKGTQYINLSNNNLRNIDGLEKIINDTDIYSIDLSNNEISDVSSLMGKKISYLNLSGNKGVTGYANLDILMTLNISNCNITVLESILPDSKIISLNISNNNITDYSVLNNMENIIELDISGNNIESLEKIKGLLEKNKITILNISNNNIKDISLLEGREKLYFLDISGNTEISNIDVVKKLSKLDYIGLRNCNIKDAESIKINSEIDNYIEPREGEEDTFIIDEEGMDVIFEDEYYDYSGITYDLSDNKGISNLGALTNAGTIFLKNCDLTDISDLSSLKYLFGVDLSGNKNLSGKYTGESLYSITLRDCGIDNSFDFFGMTSFSADIRDNNNVDVNILLDKYLDSWFYVDSYTHYTNSNFYSRVSADDYTIMVPITDNYNTEINFNNFYVEGYRGIEKLYINGNGYSNAIIIEPINENTVIECSDTYGNECKVGFYINEDIKNKGIKVVKNPYKTSYTSKNDTIDTNGIKVVNLYGYGVQTKTDDFEINGVYVIYYNRGVVTVSQDIFKAFFGINIDGAIPSEEDKELLDEDLIPPDDFEEEFPTLTFSSEELYYIAKDYWDGLYVRADDDLLTIELKEYREVNDSGLPMYIPRRLLWDVQGLKPMIITDIYILMDEDDGMDRIEEEDLKVLDSFEYLTYIHIITPPEEYNQLDLIIDQDKYIIEIENGVG